MARVLFFAIIIGATLYALIDWVMTSKTDTPGGLSRWLWLAVIIIFPVVGPAAWIILRLVGDAESRQGHSQQHPPRRQGAPDDDSQFLDDWAKKIQRRQRRSRPENPNGASGTEGPQEPEDPDPSENGK